MQPLLYLCHRIPYPPNKGDKIRTFNILKFLSNYYSIHLGAFVDDPHDFQHEDVVAEYCASYCLVPLNPRFAKLKSLTGFFRGSPLSLPYYESKRMRNWVNSILAEERPCAALVTCSTMAQYVSGSHYAQLKRYIDFIDIDSDKWAQYAKKSSFVMRQIYSYEANSLLSWEAKVAGEFDRSFFVSEKEADLFKRMVPSSASKVSYFNNGVDVDYFSPLHIFASPYAREEKVLVFTGAMDYWANVDAVVWFARHVFPSVYEKFKDAKFYIVGSKPDYRVKELADSPGIVVTGAVDDVRPYLAHASVAVVPMRIARGVQNKVLEAMAMGLPTVVSPQGFEGISATKGRDLFVVESDGDWKRLLVDLLKADNGGAIGRSARDCVMENFSWHKALLRLKQAIEGQC